MTANDADPVSAALTLVGVARVVTKSVQRGYCLSCQGKRWTGNRAQLEAQSHSRTHRHVCVGRIALSFRYSPDPDSTGEIL
jgi:hypothetical protein